MSIIVLPIFIPESRSGFNDNMNTNDTCCLECLCLPCCFPCVISNWMDRRRNKKVLKQKEQEAKRIFQEKSKQREEDEKRELEERKKITAEKQKIFDKCMQCKKVMDPDIYDLFIKGSHNSAVVNHMRTLPEDILDMIFQQDVFGFQCSEKMNYLYQRIKGIVE